MKKFLFYIIPFGMLACSGDSEDNLTQLEDLIDDSDSIYIDTVVYIQDTTTVYNGLADFFSAPMCGRIRKINSDFNRYTTNEQFDRILEDANLLLDFLRLDIYASKTQFKSDLPQDYGQPETMALMAAVDKYADSLLPIVIECGAECVEVDFFLDFESIKKPVRLSPSEADDDLVEILRRVYGVYGDFRYHNQLGWKEWWSVDFYLYAFGNDYMYDTFTMICKFETDHPGQFVTRISKIKEELVDNLQVGDGENTLHSLETIKTEFNSIKELDCLNNDQKARIQEAMEAMEASDSIQFESNDY